ncbi:MAG: hypothetical protein JEZ11_03790 [Desulfobacterales bacterium]|nr:hypothetical protein [Desulfobacterales bacterium]
MTHNIQLANPFSPYTKALKALTGKRGKSDADMMEIGRIEWEAGLYMEKGRIVMPGRCLQACFLAGSKKKKNGTKYKTGVVLNDDFSNFVHGGPEQITATSTREIPNPALDKFFEEFCNIDMVCVSGKSKVLRFRPIFSTWEIPLVSLFYDEAQIDERTVLQILEDSGYLIGLGERRPSSPNGGTLGRFTVEQL